MEKEQMTAVTAQEVKLTIDVALLEQEKRLAKEFRGELELQTERLTTAIDKQNKLYSDNIIQLNKDVTKLESKLSTVNNKIAIVGSVCTAFGGLLGFFIAQLVH